MALRKDWKFTYTRLDVANASRDKVVFHTGRLEFWKTELQGVKDAIQAGGIDIQESVAGTGYQSSPLFGAQILIKPEFQRDLNECTGKIREHADKIKEYDKFVEVLSLSGPDTVELDIDDVVFFFGK